MSSLEIGKLFTSAGTDHSEQIEILKRTKSLNIKRVHIKAKYSQPENENTPLIKEFNLNPSNVSALFKGTRNIVNGWILIK